ncbi:MAG: dihydroorotate dehydrogenase [Planctomycetales bacterium]|nr:dihydroorotate dehydrogenase [Planctomycetales bacterium]MBN8627226.1 dihydroorotate dehydrogenase [Planctomycetota bacterium]
MPCRFACRLVLRVAVEAVAVDLEVRLGRLRLPNPILTASGTFGYAREMTGFVNLASLGGIVPKTITKRPRPGNKPWRTIETTGGMLNSIGLDNDGIDAFIEGHLPYLASVGCPIVVSIAGCDENEFAELAGRLSGRPEVAAIELNVSCPNVSGGVDLGTNPARCEQVVALARKACDRPIIAKLTPNVTSVADIAKAAEAGGADAIALINTCLGMAIDWKRRKPMLGNVVGGLSGPAIKPIALRCVYQAARAVKTPLIGIGGIATLDDVMEFAVAGASAVQLGTVNFYDPTVAGRILAALPGALRELKANRWVDIVNTLDAPAPQGK